jgi:hypothetical protein
MPIRRDLRLPLAALLLVCAGSWGCIDAGSSAALPKATASGRGPGAGPSSPSRAYDLPTDADLRAMLDEAIDLTGQRVMSVREQAAWQIVHGILAYPNLRIKDSQGREVVALDYLLGGGDLNGWKFAPGDHGLDSILESGSKTGQGHEDQWLGYLSQIGMPEDQPIVWQGRTYTIRDLVTQAQWDITEGQEATWTLMGLGTYLPLDARWKSRDGSEWTLERIIAMEAAQDLTQSACGGSHRLYGLSSALNRHMEEKSLEPEQLSGGWLDAYTVIQQSIETIRTSQQPDGSFSVKYFERPATSPDVALRLNTTGHQLEFLTLALNVEQLREPWVMKAAVHLCGLFQETKDMAIECGGLYHAAHGLQLYRYRLFGPREAAAASADPAVGTANASDDAAEPPPPPADLAPERSQDE